MQGDLRSETVPIIFRFSKIALILLETEYDRVHRKQCWIKELEAQFCHEDLSKLRV